MKIFLLFYFFISFITPNFSVGQTQDSLLSTTTWKESLHNQANLGKIANALIEKGESDPLFFSYIIGPILREGFTKYPNNFFEENKMLFLFVIQQFQSIKETAFREKILSLMPFFPLPYQKEISKIELNFLLKVSPKESYKRAGEIHIWSEVSMNLPFARESFLILLDKTQEPSIQNLLRQAAKKASN